MVEPGAARGQAAIYDANRYLLSALLEHLGAVVTDLGILADEPGELARALAKAAAWHDLVITSGGVSTGEADHVRGASRRSADWCSGASPSSRAGRWRWESFAPRRARITPPTQAPLLRLAGQSGGGVRDIRAGGEAVAVAAVRRAAADFIAAAGARRLCLQEEKDRREYVRVALRRGADGEVEAFKHPQDGAGILTSLTETDGLLEFPEDVTAIEPGDRVGFLSYAALMG